MQTAGLVRLVQLTLRFLAKLMKANPDSWKRPATEAIGLNKEPGKMLRRVGSPPWDLEYFTLVQQKEKYPQNPARAGAEDGFIGTDTNGKRTWNETRTTILWNNVLFVRNPSRKEEE